MRRIHRKLLGTLSMLALLVAIPAAAHARSMGVEVWTDRGDDAVYQPGDAMQVKVRTSDDAYLLVYQIDSEGQVSVLFPWRRGSGQVDGHRTYRMPPERSGYELAVEKATGEGYIVAIASRRPFRDLPWYLRPFDPQGDVMGYEDRHDEDEGFDEQGRVVGDPMVALERIRRRVLGDASDNDDFATSYASYYVGHEVRYPRYLCADCHRPNRWAWWDGFDPYYTRCSVFDFRVNWNWCWGPCMWTGHVPYFFYVVRSDCPPHYRGWYDDRSRWSSWDGRHRWDDLWGGSLVRYKAPPPPGYAPPPPTQKPGWTPTGNLPPGYLPPNDGRRGGISRQPMPIGRGRADNGDPQPGYGGSGGPSPRVLPSDRPADRPSPRPLPGYRPPQNDQPRQESPRVEPRQVPPRQDAPHADPPQQRERPQRQDPPHREPEQRQERPQQNQDERKEPPHRDAPAERPNRDDGARGRGDR